MQTRKPANWFPIAAYSSWYSYGFSQGSYIATVGSATGGHFVGTEAAPIVLLHLSIRGSLYSIT
jgi:hypothetical protein